MGSTFKILFFILSSFILAQDISEILVDDNDKDAVEEFFTNYAEKCFKKDYLSKSYRIGDFKYVRYSISSIKSSFISGLKNNYRFKEDVLFIEDYPLFIDIDIKKIAYSQDRGFELSIVFKSIQDKNFFKSDLFPNQDKVIRKLFLKDHILHLSDYNKIFFNGFFKKYALSDIFQQNQLKAYSSELSKIELQLFLCHDEKAQRK